jgi:phosphatidylserine/phosphatidylglycerophosphate/cardiolipin synthase-like enzyme
MPRIAPSQRNFILLTLLLCAPSCTPGQAHDAGPDSAADAGPDGTADADGDGDDGGDAAPVEFWTARPANNRDYLPAALELINTAERRVHVIEYVIYPGGPVQEILDALIAAAERGVEVEVLADETGDSTEGALELLRAGGVEARLDDPSVLTHNKLIIADDVVLVGSTNLTDSALNRNNESNMLISDANVAAYYESYFQALWRDPVAEPAISWGRDTRLVPLSDRDIFDAYLGCLQGAEREVELALYAMRYDDASPRSSFNQLVDALVEAHRRGLQVQVVLDASDWIVSNEINDRATALLLEAGVPLRNPPASRITHAKLLICDDTVVVSDANWATSALERYHGTSVRVIDVELADQYRAYFSTIWDQSLAP